MMCSKVQMMWRELQMVLAVEHRRTILLIEKLIIEMLETC